MSKKAFFKKDDESKFMHFTFTRLRGLKGLGQEMDWIFFGHE